jgi:hypothetical protein
MAARLVLTAALSTPFRVAELYTTTNGNMVVELLEDAGGAPLPGGLFVDAATAVPVADQNGSIAAPFVTLQAAVDSLPAGPGSFSFYIMPGTLDAEAVDFGDKSAALIGWGAGFSPNGLPQPRVDLSNVTLTTTAELSLQSISGCGAVTAGSHVIIRQSQVDAVVSVGGSLLLDRSGVFQLVCVGSIFGNNSYIFNGATAANSFFDDCLLNVIDTSYDFTAGGGGSELRDCRIGGNLIANDLRLWDCQASGTISGQVTEFYGVSGGPEVNAVTLVADGSTLAGITLTTSGTSSLTSTSYNGLAGPALAVVNVDSYSNSFAPASGGAVKNLLAGRASLVVNVPVLAANAIGTAAAALTGSVLEGLPVDRQVVATEPTAGVTGGGFLAGVRVTTPNNITFTFHGPTTGGNQTFIVTEV